jgi:hypothetical protein
MMLAFSGSGRLLERPAIACRADDRQVHDRRVVKSDRRPVAGVAVLRDEGAGPRGDRHPPSRFRVRRSLREAYRR